ncbi:bi-domain-containing oxidoreductase [Pseudomonas sp. 10B1]|uniref:bi-domain-containing oxidoreductase n=1 Tax=unclassified Pseudomonas TaxID=196821 RepID=UPI002B22A3B7|nr:MULTISPECIES: bi-domain-containing oxidoreductase [unclassified Pseudomonas]MEA9997371.1 bi-domain-containing oxidoreductase [Pseudomonas sp. AA4]MEB0089401.1 bi-domain-containing oxidoreductase [Pseudomonas sp. RTI1]MEB0128555.1 bi-domain-containing oxidoreductase [Pseudomonas sp. CCC1.2]MEB0155833.1 bi-domain-containing oxidoreductase [Pseudomonas sp. CCC4.3]MEB0222007.1 bi-domain-containing oxidoreductase [Pseudomonas sp. AB12(2023)]
MKQVVQNMANGETSLVSAPAPEVREGTLQIRTINTLISAGTERSLVGFGKASWFEKARQQPDKVRMVLQKVQSDGLMTTVDAVRSKLAQPLPLGYCNVGTVIALGKNVLGYKVGDRVVSNGPHADIVVVPKNLCALIPDAVSDESASFTVLASIGLQGIRLAKPTLGEAFVVTGVGLIGLMTVQLLRAHGCRVLAIDFDDDKLALARSFGAETCNPGAGEDPVSVGMRFSRGRGVDGVIITASTKSSDPVTQAAQMSRKRGRIILVGVIGLELNRADFYEKELMFQVSCSYGPGRYDASYENQGNDFPIGFVRWTEQRNFEAVLDMIAGGRLVLGSLVSHRIAFEKATEAYHTLTEDGSALGIVLQYSSSNDERLIKQVTLDPLAISKFDLIKPVVGFVGAGNYASRVLIPAFKAVGAQLHTIVTVGGINGVTHGSKAGFALASTDIEAMLGDGDINTVAIVTQHDSHPSFVAKALSVGKNVFVEKPLAIDVNGLQLVEDAYLASHARGLKPRLMVGFNRRFAPQVQKIKQLLSTISEPKSFIMTMNAGAIPMGHWTQDPLVGGGRIIGEACHFIDLMRFLAGSKIVSVQARRMGGSDTAIAEDKATITLGFEDGSFGTILYFANGASSFPKERIEVFTSGRVLQLDNFRKLKGFGWPGFSKLNLWKQDKGQFKCAAAFLKSIETGTQTPIAIDELFEVARVSIEAAKILREQ